MVHGLSSYSDDHKLTDEDISEGFIQGNSCSFQNFILLHVFIYEGRHGSMWKSGQLEGDELLLLLRGDWGSNASAQPGNSGFYMLSPFAGPKASGSWSVCFV